jgi:signal transduction histidine kinase
MNIYVLFQQKVLAVANKTQGTFSKEDVDFLQPFILTVTSLIVSRRNFVQRKQTEDALRKAFIEIEAKVVELKQAKEIAEVAVKEKNQLIANISHDLRTPLNSIVYVQDFNSTLLKLVFTSGVQSLLKPILQTKEQSEYVQMIETSANILMTLVNDILNFSKLEANGVVLQEEEFNLQTTIDEILDMCALKERSPNVELEHWFDSNTTSSTVIGDKNRLSIVIQNLVDNAIKVYNALYTFLIIFSLQDKVQ